MCRAGLYAEIRKIETKYQRRILPSVLSLAIFVSMRLVFSLACALAFLLGCATPGIDWQARLGNYTYDQAVLELGPPENSATLSDGTRVGDWLISPGRSGGGGTYFITRGYIIHHIPDHDGPDRFARLTFDPQGRLTDYKSVLK